MNELQPLCTCGLCVCMRVWVCGCVLMWQCGCGMGGWVDRWVGIWRRGGVSAIGHGLHAEHYTQGSWLVHNVCVYHTHSPI